MALRLLSLLVVLGWVGPLGAENWPAWRGPHQNGHSTETDVPLRWSPTENVRWQFDLPSGGNSTPIIWGDRLFLTQARDKGTRRAVLCLDRTNGKLLWQKETVYEEKEPTHATNPYCSASPVTDGKRVVVSFGSAGMFCYDFAGQELWHKDLGKLTHIWGNASSPILYQDLVILWCGPGERQFLLAVNKETGKTVWEQKETGGNPGQDSRNWKGSWATPIIIRYKGRDELILGVPEKLKGFDPKTGKELWSCGGLGKLVYTSPVQAHGMVAALGGFHGPAIAVRLGGEGDITATHRLWQHTKGIPQRISSPLIAHEHLFILNETGLLQCLDLKTGKELAQKKLEGQFWGSPVITAEGRLYATSMAGDTFVLTADVKLERLARNSLGERVLASTVLSDGEVFIRTYKHLWCIGAPKK